MAFIVADRVREVSPTTGTGTFTLAGAVVGYQSFFGAIGNGNTTYYTISNPGVNEWEVGIGTVAAGTLARTTVLASSTGTSLVSFTAGSKDVFCTYPSEAAVFADNAVTLTNKTISGANNTLSNIPTSALTGTLAIANGGTNATSFTAKSGNVAGLVFFDGAKLTNDATVTDVGYDTSTNTLTCLNFSSSGTQTLSGGTANGVAYLNGSKVLTTGSALTFDGTTLTSGTHTIASGNLTFTGTGNRITGDFSNATVANRVMFQTSTANGASVVGILPNGTGTITQFAAYGGSDPANAQTTRIDTRGGTESRIESTFAGTPASGTYLPMTFYTGGSERMRIDTSGNLGLGVTPSAWGIGKAIETGYLGSAVWGSSPSDMYVTSNAYYNGGWKCAITGYASSAYEQATGVHKWYTAPSGTAGNAISFTQAMTLDASGNLALNTTTSSDRFTVNASDIGLIISGTNGINFRNGSRTIIQQIQYSDADGSLNIGGTSGTSNPIKISTGGTERMRIDSSGNLLVGTTSNPSAGKIVSLFNGGTTDGINIKNSNAANSGAFAGFFNSANGLAGSISHSGTTTVAYNTSSDYRLKENIQPMQNALGVVQQLNPVTYTWKADGSDGQGFIAHELQAVVPDCVTGEKDAVDAEGNPVYQGIDTSFLVATLTKAIQEQQEQINQLRAEVAELKGA